MIGPGADRTTGLGDVSPVLVVALDVPGSREALEAVHTLVGLPLWMKVGLELFTAEGPDIIQRITQTGFPVFLDLKFHDIPTTVEHAVSAACRLGTSMLTLHLSGGEAMAVAAVRARDRARAEQRVGGPLLMGVTVLTSEPARDARGLMRAVVERALAAQTWGLDGVVCSGREARAVKDACGPDFFCLCPGIRFAEQDSCDDQVRVCSPEEAASAGADFLVMGRSILRARDPASSARKALFALGGV